MGLSERGQNMGTLQRETPSDPNQEQAPRLPGWGEQQEQTPWSHREQAGQQRRCIQARSSDLLFAL